MSLRHAVPFVLAIAPACDASLESHSDSDAEVIDASAYTLAPLGSSLETNHLAPRVAPPEPTPLVVHFEAERPGPEPLGWSFTEEHVALATSTVTALMAEVPTAAAKSLLGERHFLMDLGALVLAHGEHYDPRWAAGPATTSPEPGGDHFWATRPVDVAALPAPHRLLLGQTVRVYSESREVCVATVSGFSLEAALTHAPSPDWDDEGNPIEPKPLSYTAEEVFTEGLVMLKAELTPVFGSCIDGLWADLERDTRPRVYTKGKADKALSRKALNAWRRSALYKTIDARYAEQFSADYPRPAGRWDEIEGSSPEVEVLTASDDTLVVVSADSWGGCGSPGERGLAVFRVDGKELRFVTGVAGDTAPTAWLDLDNDGHPEALYRGDQMTRMVRFKLSAADPSSLSDLYDLTDTLESVYIPDYTDHGCGC